MLMLPNVDAEQSNTTDPTEPSTSIIHFGAVRAGHAETEINSALFPTTISAHPRNTTSASTIDSISKDPTAPTSSVSLPCRGSQPSPSEAPPPCPSGAPPPSRSTSATPGSSISTLSPASSTPRASISTPSPATSTPRASISTPSPATWTPQEESEAPPLSPSTVAVPAYSTISSAFQP
jgi:hypothetical protein